MKMNVIPLDSRRKPEISTGHQPRFSGDTENQHNTVGLLDSLRFGASLVRFQHGVMLVTRSGDAQTVEVPLVY